MVFPLGVILVVAAGGVLGDADWTADPRYDGAGYAILARALATGQGYRALDHPDHPRHAHFPPGYPLALAALWSTLGENVRRAHAFSAACTVAAVAAAWLWFRRLFAGPTALVLGLALAVNWLWTRTGAAIQSEPLYLLVAQAAVLAQVSGSRKLGRNLNRAFLTGALLGLALITRWAALGMVVAVLVDRVWQGRRRCALGVAFAASAIALPWLAWIGMVASAGGATAAGLVPFEPSAMIVRVAEQAVFYLERIPDALFGPYVEVGTSRGAILRIAAFVFAAGATGVVALGLVVAGRRGSGRIAALITFVTLAMLLFWPYTEAGRFLIPLVPCLLIGALEGLAFVLHTGGRLLGLGWRKGRTRLMAAWLILGAALPYSGYQLASGRARERAADLRDFQSACRWLVDEGDQPGPVLARHPGDVYWRTGRQALEVESSERPGFADASSSAVAELIRKYKVPYLVVDRGLYANAPAGPLARFVAERPGAVRQVWPDDPASSKVVIYEVRQAE